MEQQKKVDATVYEYDEVYDSLKEAERLAAIAREEEAKIRQVQPPFFYSHRIFFLTDFYFIFLAEIYRQSVAGC